MCPLTEDRNFSPNVAALSDLHGMAGVAKLLQMERVEDDGSTVVELLPWLFDVLVSPPPETVKVGVSAD